MKLRIQPFALIIQNGVREPGETKSAFQAFSQNLLQDLQQVGVQRKMIFMTTLLQHYLGQRNLSKFCYAQLFTMHGERFCNTDAITCLDC